MKSDSIAYGVAGVAFGLIAGWVIGSQQAVLRPATTVPQAAARPADSANPPPAPVLDEAKVTAFKSVADREPKNGDARAQLGNLYFDAERYADAAKWYTEALDLNPKDVNVSTDLGVCFYNLNEP